MITDHDARQRIRSSLDESLIVEAAAGTGKTSELVRRITAVLRAGKTTVDRIVAVTFTRKAAGELKLRLRRELDRSRAQTENRDDRERLAQAVARLEEARIGTIHSFCADILRERPVEARVAPGFRELDERQARRLFQQTFELWMQRALDQLPPGLSRALSRTQYWASAPNDDPTELLGDAAWKLAEWRDFHAPWRRDDLDRHAGIDAAIEEIRTFALMAATCRRPHDELYKTVRPAIEFEARCRRTEEARRRRDYDELEGMIAALLSNLKREKSRGRKGAGRYSDEHSRVSVAAARDALIASLEAFCALADADLAALLRAELWEVVERYQEAKTRSGQLDFVDLLLLSRDLVRDNREVRRFLQDRYTHIFVDEFQDSDPMQVELLLLLSADDPEERDWLEVRPVPGKLFVVGDPKQSIYRFRRADIQIYQQVRESLVEKSVGIVELSTSFRAVPAIQHAVNAAFSTVISENHETGQPGYIPLAGSQTPIEGQPALVALPVPHPYGERNITKTAIDAELPAVVGGFIEWLIRESGWKVRDTEREGALLPMAPRHICVLFRKFVSWDWANRKTDLTRNYVHDLEARDIPHLLWGARSFHQREEVETLRAALAAIEWPDDELSVYATLRGSLFAIPDSALFRFKQLSGRLHPFRPAPEHLEPALTPVQEGLDVLAELHRRRNWRPMVETIHDLLEQTRAHASFALRPAGNQVLANVYRVCDLARKFESAGGISFRSFVSELDAEAEREESTESPLLEEGADGVRLMTLHAAKGLEFPVVILADITTGLASRNADRFIDPTRNLCAVPLLRCHPKELADHRDEEMARNQAEGVRIAYVAATRARDLLVLPAVGDSSPDDSKNDNWVRPLWPAFFPARVNRRRAEPAEGCPLFGPSSVLERSLGMEMLDTIDVQPGQHTPAAGEHRVVWWDPSLVRLKVDDNFGLRQVQILRAGENAHAAQASAERYSAWSADRDRAIAQGSLPSAKVFTATGEDASLEEVAGLPDVQVELVARKKQRPAGPRFGTLVHAVLRDVRFDAAPTEIERLAHIHGRLTAANDGEVRAAVAAVIDALRHPLLRRAATAERVYREYPVVWQTEHGRILEGVIDLAFLQESRWTVLDFKTDVAEGNRLVRYQRQVGWYCLALQKISGAATQGYLLGL